MMGAGVRSLSLKLSRVILCLAAGWLTSCNSLFYQPDHYLYVHPDRLNLPYQEYTVRPDGPGGPHLRAWLFKPPMKESKGLVLQFHGNGQNMSAHMMLAVWMTKYGYSVLTFDYRGYGVSTGEPDRAGLVEDAKAMLRFTRAAEELSALPLIVMGQSLGGAVAIPALAQSGVRPDVVILDSTFSSYHDVAENIMERSVLTWPFQWLSWILISDDLSPVDCIAEVRPKRWLFIHGKQDPVVPGELMTGLYQKATGPRDFWVVEQPGHTMAFYPQSPERKRLITYLCRNFSSLYCPGGEIAKDHRVR